MPIRFRCPQCSRLLGIARRKAGHLTTCPQCGETITVPAQEEPLDLTPLLDSENGAAPVATAPIPRAAPKPAAPKPAPRPQPRRQPGEEPPLFEGEDFEALLGTRPRSAPLDLDDESARPAAGGTDATSLEEEVRPLVLTPQRATLLVAVVVVLLGVAFALGYLIAAKT
jgi:hypothetical protein